MIVGVDLIALEDTDPLALIAELEKAGAKAWPADALLCEVPFEDARQIAIQATTEDDVRQAYRTAAAACRIRRDAEKQRKRK